MEFDEIFSGSYVPQITSSTGPAELKQPANDVDAKAETELAQAANEQEAKPRRTTIRVKLIK